MFSIQVIYDVYSPAVEAQLTRDLIALKNSAPKEQFCVICKEGDSDNLLSAFGIDLYPQGASQLTLVYKTTDQWPDHPDERDTQVVMRDLYVYEETLSIDPNPTVGYYMPQQGRIIPNQVDLAKRGPQGKGAVDPMILQVWGGPVGYGGIF